MTVDRSELHELLDEVPDDELSSVAAELRRRVRPRPARSVEPFAWMAFGPSKHAGTDDARRVDEILAEGFGRD